MPRRRYLRHPRTERIRAAPMAITAYMAASARAPAPISSETAARAPKTRRRCLSSDVIYPRTHTASVAADKTAQLLGLIDGTMNMPSGTAVTCLLYTSDAADDLLC